MSYDLMVFEPNAAPRDRDEFIKWYWKQTEWSENHDYNDPVVSSPNLQVWFQEMMISFPPLNGKFATEDFENSNVTDYSIGKNVIYAAFTWSVASGAYKKMKKLAIKHEVGFFDVSANNGAILFPDDVKKSSWFTWLRNSAR
ncbi:MAG: hypothetical protein JKY84_13525 [Emcibacteraceae bacterium]|nr:hypothetical protein [Emcibacteraceae bacterium]